MSNRFIDDLNSAIQLADYWDLQPGSLLGRKGNTLTVTGSPSWRKTQGRNGVYTPAVGGNYLSPGNPVAFQLTTGTVFAVAARSESNAADFQALVGKTLSYNIMVNLGAEPKAFGCWDYTAGAWRSSTFSERPNGTIHLFAMSFQSGVVNGTSFFVDGNPYGLTTMTVNSNAAPLNIGYAAGGGATGVGGTILLAGLSTRVWTGPEHARMYDDFLSSRLSADLPRRNFVYVYQGKKDYEYTAEGIFLDTDFVRQSDGKVRDLSPSGYAGTTANIVVPGQNGDGATFVSTASDVNFGNVTQLNNAQSFTCEWVQETPIGNIPVGYTSIVIGVWPQNIRIGPIGVPATPKRLYFGVGTGVDNYGTSATNVIRDGVKQHCIATFNGLGATDVLKAQLYVDGEDVAYQQVTGAMPAATANMAGGTGLTIGSGSSLVCTQMFQRWSTPHTSAAQARARYLLNFAQKLIWQAPGEDMPVSLVASYGVATPNALGGGWVIVSGTWKRSEDSLGRRWIECVTAGCIVRPQPNAFGTWMWTTVNNVGASIAVMFHASNPVSDSDASQNGYLIRHAATRVSLEPITGGAGAYDFLSTVGFLPGTIAPVTYCVSRRPSDGRFSVWVKGGGYLAWTLVPTAIGSNPVADITFTSSKWMSVTSALAGNKLLDFDPTTPGNPGHPRIYQGVLDPTKGEV